MTKAAIICRYKRPQQVMHHPARIAGKLFAALFARTWHFINFRCCFSNFRRTVTY